FLHACARWERPGDVGEGGVVGIAPALMAERIHVEVRLFGPSIDWVGDTLLQYEFDGPAHLSTLIELLHLKCARLRENARFVRYAVNGEYAEKDPLLHTGDEVAVIPPVAGGAPELVRLTREPIRAADLVPLVTHP